MTGRRPRIVINALSARRGGGVTYTRNLLRFLSPDLGADVYVLTAPSRRNLLPEDGPFAVIASPFAGRNIVFRTLWERFGAPRLLRKLGADVYYVLSGTLVGKLPPRCQSVVAFRNTLPFSPVHRKLYPLGYTRARLWLLRFTQGRSFEKADATIFISQHGKNLIDRYHPQRRGRSLLIAHGVGDTFFPDKTAAEPETRWPEGYVFYASVIDVYKAHLEVVEAWALLRQRRPTREKLVLAGPEYPRYSKRVRRRIAELGLGDEIVLLGSVSHPELAALYRNAVVNLYASRCENCPNILLEALASGRPIVASNEAPMPEFGGDAVAYFDPTQPEELARKLAEILDDPELRDRMARRAAERGRQYPLDGSMQRTWKALLQLAEKPAIRTGSR